MAQVKPQVIDDEQHERVYERVAAVDVAKDSWMVCTRMPHPSRPGARQSTVWTVKARMAAIDAGGLEYGSGSQDSVSACSDTAVRGSSSDRTAQSANAPIAYGAVWTSAASNVWPLR